METIVHSLLILSLRVFGRLVNAGVYVYLCAFLGSLAVRFHVEDRQADFGYAVAYLILACIYTTRPFVTLLRWCYALHQAARAKARHAFEPRALLLATALLVGDIAAGSVLLVRLWKWFVEFNAAGEVVIAVSCAALGLLHSVNTLVGTLALSLFLRLGAEMTFAPVSG